MLEDTHHYVVTATLELLERLARATSGVDTMPIATQGIDDQVENDRLIVDRQDAERADRRGGRVCRRILDLSLRARLGTHRQLDDDRRAPNGSAFGPDPAA